MFFVKLGKASKRKRCEAESRVQKRRIGTIHGFLKKNNRFRLIFCCNMDIFRVVYCGQEFIGYFKFLPQ